MPPTAILSKPTRKLMERRSSSQQAQSQNLLQYALPGATWPLQIWRAQRGSRPIRFVQPNRMLGAYFPRRAERQLRNAERDSCLAMNAPPHGVLRHKSTHFHCARSPAPARQARGDTPKRFRNNRLKLESVSKPTSLLISSTFSPTMKIPLPEKQYPISKQSWT